MTLKPGVTVLALAMASVSFGASATENKDIIKISDWNYEKLYEAGGVRAESLMDAEVFGSEGEEIGSVENLIIGKDNRIVAVIAQVGGLWDIGDTHVAVPWDEVELTEDGVKVPITEDNADDYGIYANDFVTKENLKQTTPVDDDLATGDRTWKATDLLNDYATLDGAIGYGYVDNIIFSEDGKIEAVVVESTSNYGGGTYAYPFYGSDYGWNPGYDAYELPYSEDEVDELEEFDYDDFDDSWYWG
ncbi:PRC-barrel domain-containing protein [Marinobacter salicampi]|uniref:PRC-barrel domain-containing protein n=1 Tax=Marinobacter salicampi TaxID=435907 RepID=UPI001A9532BC|nr:PRC-barrel domain-containing protein [Marinobacter salicampi]